MKYVLIIITSLFFLTSCTSDPVTSDSTGSKTNGSEAESPDISIEVKNMPAGDVFLIGTFSGQNYRVDSTSIDASGKLKFQSDDPYIPGMYFVVFSNNASIQLLLDMDQTMEIKTDATDIALTTEVKGNIDTKLLYENFVYENDYRAKLAPLVEQKKAAGEGTPQYQSLKAQQDVLVAKRTADLEKIFKQYPNSLFTSFKSAGQNPEVRDVRNPDGSVDLKYQVYLYQREFWDNVDFSDLRLLYTPVITNKLKRYMEQLTTQHPDSINNAASFLIDKVVDHPQYFKYFVNYIALTYEPGKNTLMDSEKVYVHMIQNYFTKEKAFWADSMVAQGLQQRAYEMSASLIGLKGPDVTAMDTKGQPQSIYNLKSDYIVVYLFTPTCEHCMEETPKLIQLHEKLKNKGLDVYAIAIDTNDQEWRGYVKKTGMQFTCVYDPTNRAIYAKYFVDITPEIYVLNKERTIIAKNLKVSQVEEMIRRDRGE